MPRSSGPRLPAVAALATAAALAAACASGRLPAPAVAERARASFSYTGSLQITLDGPEMRARARALVAFRRPDALRIEVPGPAGLRLVAVARAGRLVAAFPAERAVFRGAASAFELRELLGVEMTPPEVMDLLVGAPVARLRSCRVTWGASFPRAIRATLPDGAKIRLQIHDPQADAELPDTAFLEPLHDGYRPVAAAEARRFWGAR